MLHLCKCLKINVLLISSKVGGNRMIVDRRIGVFVCARCGRIKFGDVGVV